MNIKKIEYPTSLSEIKDITNDNIDVFVELEDGSTYVLVVATPKNLYWCMENENVDFLCGCPQIIVKEF